MRKPSRLYRVLADCPKPIFQFTVYEAGNRTDDELTSITIRHGQDAPTGGVPVATCETGFTGYMSPRTGQLATVRLTDTATVWFQNLLGTTNIQDRFNGRAGIFEVNDEAGKITTRMTASSWSSQLSNRGNQYTFNQGHYVSDAIETLLRNPSLPVVPTVSRGDASHRDYYGRIYDRIENETYSNIISKLTSDIGVLVRQHRNGTLQPMPINQRRSDANKALDNYPPIPRSQVLSPTAWVTNNEDDPTNHYIMTRKNISGDPTGANFGNLNQPWRAERETDLLYLIFENDDQWKSMGYAQRNAEYSGAYSLPSVEVDILMLLDRASLYDLMQAAALLQLQPGDPVTFSGDWYPHLQGVMFAESITETITPDQWVISLGLIPLPRVTGDDIVIPYPRTWDQASGTWNEATGTWNSYAL